MTVTVVIAGTRREFLEWCRRNHRRHNDRNVIFANNPDDLLQSLRGGHEPIKVEKVGTYYRLRSLMEINQTLGYLQASRSQE